LDAFFVGKRVVDAPGSRYVLVGGRRRFYVRDEIWGVFLARFSHVNLVAAPFHRTLLAIPNV